MTTQVADFNNPSFQLFPVNNDRTAWRPFGLPVILVEPNRRDPLGNSIELSLIENVRIAVEDVQQKAPIAGHDHVGEFFPNAELFAITVSRVELQTLIIEPSGQQFFQPDGTEITFAEATLGDFMQYTTISGVRDTITYIPSANYYDLSNKQIDVEALPSDRYFLTYSGDYFARIVAGGPESTQLICIDSNTVAKAIFRFRFNHPGEVIDEQVGLTPEPYISQVRKQDDPTVQFYRPFTDAFQDLFDETELLEKVNWVNNITPELVPYLAFLLGLDIPYFPRSLDKLRTVMLKNIVRLQQLKGSRRALIDLFNLFGFNIFIINLYWSEKACRLVRPGEELPPEFEDQEIKIVEKCQIEPILADYDTDGFGQLTIPLVFRPTQTEIHDGVASRVDGGSIIIDGYLVEDGSEAYNQLVQLTSDMNDDPLEYGESVNCTLPPITGTGITGYSQIIIDSLTGQLQSEAQMGIQPPFSGEGTGYILQHNALEITFDGAIIFGGNGITGFPPLKLFAFTTYDRNEFIVPEDMQNLQSNRFDVQLLTRESQQIEPEVLAFLIDFLFKFKAFHSILNVIIYRIEFNETYEVTDWCVGGDVTQRFDTDVGRLQVPPAIIPQLSDDECARSPEDLGYKPEDILLRGRKIENLENEHEAWKELDARAGQDLSSGSSRIDAAIDNLMREECKFNPLGQDRIIPGTNNIPTTRQEYHPGPNVGGTSVASDPNLDPCPVEEVDKGAFDPINKASRNGEYTGYGSFTVETTEVPTPFCDPNGVTDYCYKGRVQDEALHQEAIAPTDSYKNNVCQTSMGTGFYYAYPVLSELVSAGSIKNYYSGSASRAGIRGYLESSQQSYLLQDYNKALSSQNNSFLGRLLRAYDSPDVYSLHYTNRRMFEENNKKQSHALALQRPELGIEVPTMHFPGTRFASMNKLVDDYTHPVYTARPWDDAYSTYCGPLENSCGNAPTFLNAELYEDTDGNILLSFDERSWFIPGNGLEPDISSLSDQDVPTTIDWDDADLVVHAIYSSQIEPGHPAIDLEQLCPCNDTDMDGFGEIISVDEPVFQSAKECDSTGYMDYCDGYKCIFGYQDRGDTSIDRDGLYADVFDCLGIPVNDEPSNGQSLFLLGSGILVGQGIRLDCGCSMIDCDDTTATTDITGQIDPLVLPCNTDLFFDQEGVRDWELDQVELDVSLKLEEPLGVHCYRLDGSIPTLFELIDECPEETN